MRKKQNGDRAPFWCTFLVFTRSDGQCFVPPVIIHQAKEYSKDLHHNITLDWKVHHTSSGYMDRDRWLKAMNQFSNICGASPVNNQILFFDGHDSHSNDHALTQMKSKKIQPFILKLGESINDQPNDNGPNSKLKALYNISKAEWMMNYGTTRLWEYTGFGTTIGLLNLRAVYDECHKLTRKPRRFPLGTLGTEPITDS